VVDEMVMETIPSKKSIRISQEYGSVWFLDRSIMIPKGKEVKK
jgi:hypothetical protein